MKNLRGHDAAFVQWKIEISVVRNFKMCSAVDRFPRIRRGLIQEVDIGELMSKILKPCKSRIVLAGASSLLEKLDSLAQELKSLLHSRVDM